MTSSRRGIAVVTGASVGIGAATARQLSADGFDVVLGARRADRVTALATELGDAGLSGTGLALDVTDQASVDSFTSAVRARSAETGRPVQVLVNNAGGARGLEPVEAADVEAWQWMYEVNVIGVLRMTKALLPSLEASGAGHVVVMSSIAGRLVYEGGARYVAAKHGATVLAETLRLELVGRPVRVTEIAPGLVRTEEFSLSRFGGDTTRAYAVYEGVEHPLTAEDIADCVSWCVTRPPHVDIDLLVVKPLAQAAPHRLHRGPIGPRNDSQTT